MCESSNTYLVLQAKMQVRKHVQTWRQQGHLYGDDAQLTFLCLPGIPSNADDVTTAQFIVDMNEIFLRFVVSKRGKKAVRNTEA